MLTTFHIGGMNLKVAFVKIKQDVYEAVGRAMVLCGWEATLKDKKYLFIKINAVSDEVLPGRNASPWVVDAVLENIRKAYPNLRVVLGDCDCAGSKQFWRAAKNWGYDRIARKHNCRIVNLSDEQLIKVNIKGKHLKTVEIPKILEEVDAIINIPVLKTHILTGITCCLKNHWGLLPRMRHNLHEQVNQVIADVNRYFKKTVFNVVDCSVCIEGSGPKTGVPRITNVIIASKDRVAADAACAEMIGLETPKHVKFSEEAGVGKTKLKIVGDRFEKQVFKQAEMRRDLVGLFEYKFRRTPILSPLIFKTPLFRLFAAAGTNYNRVWYFFQKRKAKKYILRDPLYRKEFKRIL